MADAKEKRKKAVKRIRKAVRKAVSKGVTELQISRTVDYNVKRGLTSRRRDQSLPKPRPTEPNLASTLSRGPGAPRPYVT